MGCGSSKSAAVMQPTSLETKVSQSRPIEKKIEVIEPPIVERTQELPVKPIVPLFTTQISLIIVTQEDKVETGDGATLIAGTANEVTAVDEICNEPNLTTPTKISIAPSLAEPSTIISNSIKEEAPIVS